MRWRITPFGVGGTSLRPSRRVLGAASFLPREDSAISLMEYQRLAEVNALAEKHFRDGRLSMRGDTAKAAGHHGRVSRVPRNPGEGQAHLHPG